MNPFIEQTKELLDHFIFKQKFIKKKLDKNKKKIDFFSNFKKYKENQKFNDYSLKHKNLLKKLKKIDGYSFNENFVEKKLKFVKENFHKEKNVKKKERKKFSDLASIISRRISVESHGKHKINKIKEMMKSLQWIDKTSVADFAQRIEYRGRKDYKTKPSTKDRKNINSKNQLSARKTFSGLDSNRIESNLKKTKKINDTPSIEFDRDKKCVKITKKKLSEEFLKKNNSFFYKNKILNRKFCIKKNFNRNLSLRDKTEKSNDSRYISYQNGKNVSLNDNNSVRNILSFNLFRQKPMKMDIQAFSAKSFNINSNGLRFKTYSSNNSLKSPQKCILANYSPKSGRGPAESSNIQKNQKFSAKNKLKKKLLKIGESKNTFKFNNEHYTFR